MSPNINPEARIIAQNWYHGCNEQPYDTSRCPRTMSEPESFADLASSKPEFYGRTALFITTALQRSLDARSERGSLGLINWDGSVVTAQDIHDYASLSQALYQTLVYDIQAHRTELFSFDPDDKTGSEQFRKQLAYEALLKQRAALKGYGFGDIISEVQTGVHAATTHTTKLIPLIYDLASTVAKNETQALELVLNSYKPLMRLAAVDAGTLADFGERYLVRANQQTFLGATSKGRIDVLPSVRSELAKSHTNEHQPTIGCPILFKRNSIKDIWQWSVMVADTCGLLAKDSPYH